MTQEHLLRTYQPLPISFTHGNGVWLYDQNNKRHLDAFSGIAVTGLGHNHPAVVQAIQNQAAALLHTSHLVEIPQEQELAKILNKVSGFDAKAFFCNSGAEAVESAIKLSRLYAHSRGINEPLIAVMTTAFHGRTMATLSAGDSKKVQAGFEPLVPGFVRIPYNDTAALATAAANKNIVAVLLEPIQGEAGIKLPSETYLQEIRKICDQHSWLFILDEIQTGIARTGKFFAYQHTNVTPDAVTLAKGLANGIPIGALLVSPKYADLFTPGSHGTTFGGNPLSCAAGIATINTILTNKLWENAARQGSKLLAGFKNALAKHPNVVEIRGKGLMLGIELDRPCREILNIALKHGVIFNIARETTMRLLPPLIIGDAEVELLIDVIPKLVHEFNRMC